MDDRDYLRGFVTWYLRRTALLIRSTEAAAFTIHREGGDPRFEWVSHIRRNSSSEEIREAARKAFVDLVTPCAKEERNGVFDLTGDKPARLQFDPSQYCLVVLIRGINGDQSEPIAVAAFIGRYTNLAEATRNMEIAALLAPPPKR